MWLAAVRRSRRQGLLHCRRPGLLVLALVPCLVGASADSLIHPCVCHSHSHSQRCMLLCKPTSVARRYPL